LLRGQVLAAMKVLLDDLLVHHQSVLVHHRLKDIDNATFLLCVMTDFTSGYRVDLVQYWQEQLVKHPITEVTLDDDFVDLFFLSDDGEFLQCFL
jgi:hypothetical protein